MASTSFATSSSAVCSCTVASRAQPLRLACSVRCLGRPSLSGRGQLASLIGFRFDRRCNQGLKLEDFQLYDRPKVGVHIVPFVPCCPALTLHKSTHRRCMTTLGLLGEFNLRMLCIMPVERLARSVAAFWHHKAASGSSKRRHSKHVGDMKGPSAPKLPALIRFRCSTHIGFCLFCQVSVRAGEDAEPGTAAEGTTENVLDEARCVYTSSV